MVLTARALKGAGSVICSRAGVLGKMDVLLGSMVTRMWFLSVMCQHGALILLALK